jgi:hypothetical protein
MQGAPDERWEMLCELAANEQDPQKLLALVQEINDLLEKKRNSSTSANRAGLQMPGSEISR